MSIETTPHQLAAVADPQGKEIGFLIPVFVRDRSNALRVERADDTGRVTAFVDLQPQETLTIQVESRESDVGAPAHWAFGFGRGDIIVGQGEDGRGALRARLEDRFFLEHPLLAVEVAEFLRLPVERLRFAEHALHQLRRLTPKTVSRWRDLSILTPDIREAVAAISASDSERSLRNISRLTARVEDNTVQIRGLELNIEPALRSHASRSIMATLEKLKPLYATPPAGWRVEFIEPEIEQKERKIIGYDLSNLSALVYIADENAEVLQRVFSRPAVDEVGLYAPRQLSQFSYQSSEFLGPSFILFSLDGRLNKVWSDDNRLLDRIPIGLATRTSSSPRLTNAERSGLGRYSHSSIVITKREIGPRFPRVGLAGETRDAVHLLASAWSHELQDKLRARTNFFLSASGTGPRPQDDAWAQIFGRTWRLGLTRPTGVIFDLEPIEYDFGTSQRPLTEILFGDLGRLNVRYQPRTKNRSTTNAAMLVTGDQIPASKDWRLYGDIVGQVLDNQRWSISRGQDSDGPALVLGANSPYDHFNVSISMEKYTSRARYSFSGLLDQDPGEVKNIIATEDAGAGAVLTHLFERRELLATIRDLSAFPAEHGTIWSLLASQMRRFSSSLPSRTRSHYFAMLCQAAVRHGHVDWEHAGRLVRAIHDPDFGHTIHLSCGRVLYEPDRTISLIRLTHGERHRSNELFSSNELDLRFRLIISDRSPEIAPAL